MNTHQNIMQMRIMTDSLAFAIHFSAVASSSAAGVAQAIAQKATRVPFGFGNQISIFNY
jgi:hypothetical protein